MSVTAMGMALEASGISPRAKVVLIAICNCANEYTFEGFPGRKDLARIADCSLDTIDRCLRELTEGGFLEKTERPHERGGLTSNLYRVFPQHDPSRRNTATHSREFAEGGERRNAARVNPEMRPPWPQAYAATLAAHGAATKEPESEPLDAVVVVARTTLDFRAMIKEAQARAGAACNLTSGNVHHVADLRRLVDAGCDWDADVLPAIDRLAASFIAKRKQFSSWALVNEAALENRDRRLAGLPEPSKPTEQPRRTSGRVDHSSIIARVFAEEEAKRHERQTG